MTMRTVTRAGWAVAAILAVGLAVTGCSSKKPPVARPVQPPDSSTTPAPALPPPPPPPTSATPVRETPVTPAPKLPEDTMASRSVDDLNRDSPFKPVFFGLDNADLSPEGRAALDENATILKTYSTWTVTIEGHCDERGTAEYNLALGDRRAEAAKAYLVSLGIPASRVRTVSYGKEFPFDPGHDESAWARNRRAHTVITGK
jgi:peptidoglycan-associated lipoprotein